MCALWTAQGEEGRRANMCWARPARHLSLRDDHFSLLRQLRGELSEALRALEATSPANRSEVPRVRVHRGDRGAARTRRGPHPPRLPGSVHPAAVALEGSCRVGVRIHRRRTPETSQCGLVPDEGPARSEARRRERNAEPLPTRSLERALVRVDEKRPHASLGRVVDRRCASRTDSVLCQISRTHRRGHDSGRLGPRSALATGPLDPRRRLPRLCPGRVGRSAGGLMDRCAWLSKERQRVWDRAPAIPSLSPIDPRRASARLVLARPVLHRTDVRISGQPA